MILLALDPGLRHPAVALFQDGALIHASRVKVPGKTHSMPLGRRIRAVCRLIRDHVDDKIATIALVDALVTEWPKVRGRRSVSDPSNLFPLAAIGMCLAGMINNPDLDVQTPMPHEWLHGNTPKSTTGNPWDSPRGSKAKSRLTLDELASISVSHDAIDAVCIGLWALGRFDKVHSFIGAT